MHGQARSIDRDVLIRASVTDQQLGRDNVHPCTYCNMAIYHRIVHLKAYTSVKYILRQVSHKRTKIIEQAKHENTWVTTWGNENCMR